MGRLDTIHPRPHDTEKTMRFSIRKPAEPGTTFARTAFDNAIGKEIDVDVAGHPHRGTIVAAEVEPDGREVTITLDVPDMSEGELLPGKEPQVGLVFHMGNGRP